MTDFRKIFKQPKPPKSTFKKFAQILAKLLLFFLGIYTFAGLIGALLVLILQFNSANIINSFGATIILNSVILSILVISYLSIKNLTGDKK